jgi:hypothetical protein
VRYKVNIVLYTSWWGLSKSGRVLCLVTDFGVYPRPEYADDDD